MRQIDFNALFNISRIVFFLKGERVPRPRPHRRQRHRDLPGREIQPRVLRVLVVAGRDREADGRATRQAVGHAGERRIFKKHFLFLLFYFDCVPFLELEFVHLRGHAAPHPDARIGRSHLDLQGGERGGEEPRRGHTICLP